MMHRRSVGHRRPSRMTIGRSAAAALAAALLGLSLAGCVQVPQGSPNAGSDGDSTAYSTEFRTARAAATSEFELKVLEDDDISSAEYEEAMDLFFECLESRGLEVTPKRTDSGLYTFDLTGSWDDTEVNAATTECAAGTSDVIEPLYSAITQNPAKRDIYELTAECLVAVGFVEAPFTGDDFMREFDTPEFATKVMDDPSGARCMQNPSSHNPGATP